MLSDIKVGDRVMYSPEHLKGIPGSDPLWDRRGTCMHAGDNIIRVQWDDNCDGHWHEVVRWRAMRVRREF